MKKERFITKAQLNLISEPEAKFLLDHAEKQLKEILETNTLIVSRTTTLLTLIVGASLALLSFCINRWDAKHCFDEILVTAIVGLFYMLYILKVLGINITPTEYVIQGAEPKKFFNDVVFNDKNGSYRMIQIYVNEIEEYQYRIATNKPINEKRWDIFNHSVSLIKRTPFILAGVYIISLIICLLWK